MLCFSDKWSVLGHFNCLDNKLVMKLSVYCLDQIFWTYGVGPVISWLLVYSQVVSMKISSEISILSFLTLFLCVHSLHLLFDSVPKEPYIIWLSLPRIESLGGRVRNFLLERGDKPVKVGGGGVDVEMGVGLPLFYYFTVQSYLLCVRGK